MRRLSICLAAVLAAWPVPRASAEPQPTAIWRQFFARPAPEPVADPVDQHRVALGRRLFFDKRLSGPGTRACATCHRPGRAFTDGLPTARGLSGLPLRRNTPSVLNLAAAKHFYWDGRMPSLEAQARVPIEAADEMAGRWPAILVRLSADEATTAAFARAFPQAPAPSETSVLAALAAYERSLVSLPTRFDAWIAGDEQALTPREAQGFELFVGKAGCVQCHVGWRFTDDRFHDIGLASSDLGRGAVPGGIPGLAAFKTPGLRDIARTAPYMHDGALATLDGVLDHYTGKFRDRPGLSSNMKRDLRLEPAERRALIAFLQSLTTPPKKR